MTSYSSSHHDRTTSQPRLSLPAFFKLATPKEEMQQQRSWLCVLVAVAVAVLALSLPLAAATKEECGAKCAERYHELVRLSEESPSGVIQLNNALYNDLVRPATRNYTILLMLNAVHPKHGCVPCRDAGNDFETLSRLVREAYPDRHDVFLAQADFEQAQEVFSALKCSTAPVVYHVMERGAPKPCSTRAYEGNSIAQCLREHGVTIKFVRPVDKTQAMISALLMVLLVLAAIIFRSTILTFLTPAFVAQLAILFCCLMMAGTMWVQIRGAPYNGMSREGKLKAIGDGTQMMYGMESHIVTGLLALSSLAIILLVDKAGPSKSLVGTVFCVVAFSVVFSLLYRLFRTKSGGYPFKFLF